MHCVGEQPCPRSWALYPADDGGTLERRTRFQGTPAAERGCFLKGPVGIAANGTSRSGHSAVRAVRRPDQDHHLLHVCLPLRHPGAPEGRQGPLHRRQPRSPGQQGRDLRQGLRGPDDAHFAVAAACADEARRPQGLRRVRGDHLGRGAADRDRLAEGGARPRSDPPRLLHRPRPEPGADRLVRAAIRHAELRRPWRILLGQHGGGRTLYVRRLVLGVRRAGLGAHPLFHAVRRRRRPRLEPAQDRARQAQGEGRQGRRRQPDPHRLWRDRRRVDRHPARHRRHLRRRTDPRTDAGAEDRSRLSRRATPMPTGW